MPKTNKLLLIVLVLITAFFGINVFKKTNKQSLKVNITDKQEKNLNSQENEGGNVTITAEPKALKMGEKPAFKIEFNTHSVDLSFDISKQSYLLDNNGDRLTNGIWNGSPAGGHHREGILTFNEVLSKTKFVKLIIRNVSGIPERTFRWEL